MAKIILTTGIFPPDSGGPASYVPLMAKELMKLGHEVKVFTYSDQTSLPEDQHYPFKVFRLKRRLFMPWRELLAFITLLKLSLRQQIIYVNGNDFKSTLVGKILRIPRVHKIVGDYAWERVTNHGLFQGTIDEYQKEKSNLRFAFYNWHRSFPLKSARQIIVPSHYLKSLVIGWGINPEKVKVIYNASAPLSNAVPVINLPSFSGKTLITICRLTAWKGVEDIIKAMLELKNCRLLIVGDGPLENSLKKLTEDLKLTDRVTFAGFVPKEMIPSYLKLSDIFILNSTYEGLPHVVLEAMAEHIPVIATNAGGTHELVIHEKTGLLIAPQNLAQLTESIKILLANSELCSRLTDEAHKNLTNFSFSNMIRETAKTLTH